MKTKYNSLEEWRLNEPKKFNSAMHRKEKNGKKFIDIVCEKAGWENTVRNFRKAYTKDECLENIKKYSTFEEWKKLDKKIYAVSLRKKWLDDILNTVGWVNTTKKLNNFTLEECIESAKPFKERVHWLNESPNHYHKAKRNGWLDECCKHMKESHQKYPMGWWDIKSNVIDVAIKCKTKTEFTTKYNGAYNGALRNGWLDDCHKHMG